MPAILLYHLYPINHWRQVTDILFQKLPFERIVVHVSLPQHDAASKQEIENYFRKYPVNEILYSLNSGRGEVDAMKSFVQTQDLKGFGILTYMHCKGVSKPDNSNILEWTKMMRYFIIEKMDVCKKVFRGGFVTFGSNKSVPDQRDAGFNGCNFFYEGNFVSLNLDKIDLARAVAEHLEDTYYGLEGFWGKLCVYRYGYAAFNSGINHYLMSLEERDYATPFGRERYNLIRRYYILRARLQKVRGRKK